jgi:two-component system, response regulator
VNDGVILLVEDDPNLAELVKLQLKQDEFTNEVVVACDGVEAIDYLLEEGRKAHQMPCLVLLDLHMPRMDGFGVLRKMRSDERTRLVPVVMLGSSNHHVDVRVAYEEGLTPTSMRCPGGCPGPSRFRRWHASGWG